MPQDPEAESPYGLPAFRDRRALASLAAIGIVVGGVAAAFVACAGWLSLHRLTPARMIDTFERVNGVHPGFRRNHAKGVCIAGAFDSNGAGARLSKAAVFAPGRSPVIGRFALAPGVPTIADSPKTVRSMALSFRPTHGQEWRTGMNDIPVFPVGDAQAFYQQLRAGRPDPATGKPDPTRMKAFVAAHPATARALQLISATPVSSGFDNASYNSLDAFRFIDAHGTSTPVRWSMVASEPFAPAGATAGADPNALFDALIGRLRQGPLRWRLVVVVGQRGDPTNDASRPWPADRRRVEVGVLTIDHVEAEGPGNCRDVNFDPLVLPDGMAASDDPLLSARSAAYANSFTRRAGERKTPSAVQTGVAGRGE